MNDFVSKASTKLSQLSDEQIMRVISLQSDKIKLETSILDSLSTGYLVTDKTGKIIFINKYLIDVISLDFHKISYSHTSYKKIISNQKVADYVEAQLKSTDTQTLEFEHQSSLYGQMKFTVSSVLLKDFNYVLFVFTDITLFEKIKIEYKKNESLASMTTMAAGVAHEIKNPLASISIYLQLLQKKINKNGSITKKEADKSLTVISSEIERLNSMVLDFLFAVKPMNVKLCLNDVNVAIEKSCTLAKPELDKKGIELNINTARSLPKILMDESLMQQCLLNLIQNSVQAMDERTDHPLIQINTFLEGDFVKISVSDNGCGISEEHLSKIFEPYFTTKPTGTGLGLTTIFKIVKEHNGEINATSEEGKGTVFTIQIPVPKSERYRLN